MLYVPKICDFDMWFSLQIRTRIFSLMGTSINSESVDGICPYLNHCCFSTETENVFQYFFNIFSI